MTKDKYPCFGFKNSFRFVSLASLIEKNTDKAYFFSHKIVAKIISVGWQMFWC